MSFEPGGFAAELENLLNRHSKENESGTPDYILAAYLTGCLDVYNKTIKARSEHLGVELTQVPKHSKKVPVVTYDEHGRRDEIGEAEVEVWPGEVRVEGVLTNLHGVIPILDGISLQP